GQFSFGGPWCTTAVIIPQPCRQAQTGFRRAGITVLPYHRPPATLQIRDMMPPCPAPTSLGNAFAAIVAQYPDHSALTWADGTLSYRELAARSAALAGRLAAVGVGSGQVVGLYM